MKKLIYTADIGGTTIKMGTFSKSGELITKWEVPTRTEENGKYILEDLADTIKKDLKVKGLDETDLIGVGVGVPGPVTKIGIIPAAVNLGWKLKNVKNELSLLLNNAPVYVGNDANVAALGEAWKGSGKEFGDVVLITLGTGVGCGIINDGKIILGHAGNAGELGHTFVQKNEELACNCGAHGCLEQYSSATGVVRVAHRILDKKTYIDSELRKLDDFSCKDVFDYAKEGDKLAQETVTYMAGKLGLAMGFLSTIVDPAVYILGGGVSKAGDYLIEEVRKAYRETAYHVSKNSEIRIAELGNDAGIYGCAKLVIDSVKETKEDIKDTKKLNIEDDENPMVNPLSKTLQRQNEEVKDTIVQKTTQAKTKAEEKAKIVKQKVSEQAKEETNTEEK